MDQLRDLVLLRTGYYHNLRFRQGAEPAAELSETGEGTDVLDQVARLLDDDEDLPSLLGRV
jgi:hypothetical protein